LWRFDQAGSELLDLPSEASVHEDNSRVSTLCHGRTKPELFAYLALAIYEVAPAERGNFTNAQTRHVAQHQSSSIPTAISALTCDGQKPF
jgi:hypothetical protein